MEELTTKQIRTRWVDIKKQINSRQLLAYRVNIPIEKWDSYMYSTPSNQEVNRIYIAIQEDRKVKTERIKEALSKIVGYRESKEFSRKSGVSDTSIRNIIEGKKTMAGYEIIDKLELFLNSVLQDFELSIENSLTLKSYSQDYIGDIASEINSIADNLKGYCFKLSEMARTQKLDEGWDGSKISPTESLISSMRKLTDCKDKIDSFWGVYLDKTI